MKTTHLLGIAALFWFLSKSQRVSPYAAIPANVVSNENPAMTERFEAKLIDSGINPQTFGSILPTGSTARIVSDLAFQTGEIQPLMFNGKPISESPAVYEVGGNPLSFQTYGAILQGFSADTQQVISSWASKGWSINDALQGLLTRQGYVW